MKKSLVCFIAIYCAAYAGIYYKTHRSETYIRNSVVKLSSDEAMCSGERVRTPSGNTYILSAAHCAHIADDKGKIKVTLENGHSYFRKIIAEDKTSDLLLIQDIKNDNNALDIAARIYHGEPVRTFTHGHDYATYKTEGELVEITYVQIPIRSMEELEPDSTCTVAPKYKVASIQTPFGELKACVMGLNEVVTTAFITQGSSGGPVVNSYGELVGVVSAGNGQFGLLVSIKDINHFLKHY